MWLGDELHPAIVAIWCYWKVSRVSTICANSQWCLASNSQYNASCCGFLLWSWHQGSWWDEVSILETSNTNNQNHSQISLEATKKMDQKKGSPPCLAAEKTRLFDAPRPHHPSPGCPKPAGHFSKEGVSVTGVFDLLWPLTTWHLGNWWRPSPPWS